MPRHAKSPGFADRIERVRHRLGYLTHAAFADALGVEPGALQAWRGKKESAPACVTLKRAVKRLGVWGWRDLLVWLCDGEDPPPRWLEDESLDPRAPESPEASPPDGPPRPGLAVPSAALEQARLAEEVYSELDAARVSVGLKEPHTIRAWNACFQVFGPKKRENVIQLPRLDSNQETAGHFTRKRRRRSTG